MQTVVFAAFLHLGHTTNCGCAQLGPNTLWLWLPMPLVVVAFGHNKLGTLGGNKLWGIGCGTWPQQTVVTTNCRNCSCHWALTANNLCDFSNVVAFGHNKLLGIADFSNAVAFGHNKLLSLTANMPFKCCGCWSKQTVVVTDCKSKNRSKFSDF